MMHQVAADDSLQSEDPRSMCGVPSICCMALLTGGQPYETQIASFRTTTRPCTGFSQGFSLYLSSPERCPWPITTC